MPAPEPVDGRGADAPSDRPRGPSRPEAAARTAAPDAPPPSEAAPGRASPPGEAGEPDDAPRHARPQGAALPPCGPAELAERLAPLPVRALGLDAATVRLLERLGLRTIRALGAVPRDALMRRFADRPADRNPLVLLDRATGRLPDPVDGPRGRRRLAARARLAEPVPDAAPHLPALCEELGAALAEAGLGARLLQLTIYRVDGTWRSAEVATAGATRDPAHMRRLLEGRLDRIDPGFGFDLLTLEALRTEPLDPRQAGLGGKAEPAAEVDALLDRLTARLGPGRVMWSHWRESHLPERVEVRVPALGARPAAPPVVARERPLRLLDPAEEVRVLYAVPEGPPARFVWRRVRLEVARHEGPERIAPEWWRAGPGTRLRDYYKVEVTDGRRLWLYREGVLGDGRGRVMVIGEAADGTSPERKTAPIPDPGTGEEATEAAGRIPPPPGPRDQRDGGASSGVREASRHAPPVSAARPSGEDGARGRAAPVRRGGPEPAGYSTDDVGSAIPPGPPPDRGGEDGPRPEDRGAVLPFRRPAARGGEGPPPLAAPAIHDACASTPPEEGGGHSEEAEARVLAFSAEPAPGDGPREVELPPRWFVHGLFA